MVKSSFNYRRTSQNKRIVAIASLLAVDKARNSASIKNVMTIIYLSNFYVISPLNRVNKYSYVDFLSC